MASNEAWERLERSLAAAIAKSPVRTTQPETPVATEPIVPKAIATESVTTEKPKLIRATRAARHKVKQQQPREGMKKPLAPADGNKRRGRAKPSSKEKENIAQQEDGIIVLDDGTVDVAEPSASAQPMEISQWAMLREYLDTRFSRLESQNAELKLQNERSSNRMQRLLSRMTS